MNYIPPKYPRIYHWPTSPGLQNDDRVHLYPEYFLGVEVVVTEKLDGGNTCLYNGKVYARSTGQEATAGWFAMVKKHHAYKSLIENGTRAYYGEDLYGIHSIEYNPLSEDKTFNLFAVRDLGDGFVPQDIFWAWDYVVETARLQTMPHVPVVFRGKFLSKKEISDFFEEEIQKPSALGPIKEGFVMRFAEAFTADEFSNCVCKYVRKGHIQTDQHWTQNWKPCRLEK
jgi:hypothetical protein